MDNNIEDGQNNNHNAHLDMGRGCEFCGCGGEAKAEACDGCFKLHTTDWLAEYPDNLPDDIIEVRFKNTRRSYYQNINNLSLEVGDIVAVEASPGHDIGIVSLTGDMVSRQMKRVGFNPLNGEFKKIYRKAKPHDIEKWQEAIGLEHNTMISARRIAADMNLNMKIGDVEYQGDKIKAIFYYIADDRVDFRELIKVFADQFRIRIEMKQIGARQEAGRIGGLGSCGRELCCSSWISSFSSVTTNAARTQDISLNPQKLAGQCSKLKCCLMYEYDDYMDAIREFPKVNEPLRVMDGDYFFVKNDILARTMSFSTAPNSMEGLVWLPVDRVREIQRMNRKGIKPDRIEDNAEEAKPARKGDFVDLLGEDSITRFDSAAKRKRSGKKNKGGGKEAQKQDNEPDGGSAKKGDRSRQKGAPDNSAPEHKNAKQPHRKEAGNMPENRGNAANKNKRRNEKGNGVAAENTPIEKRESTQKTGEQKKRGANRNRPAHKPAPEGGEPMDTRAASGEEGQKQAGSGSGNRRNNRNRSNRNRPAGGNKSENKGGNQE